MREGLGDEVFDGWCPPPSMQPPTPQVKEFEKEVSKGVRFFLAFRAAWNPPLSLTRCQDLGQQALEALRSRRPETYECACVLLLLLMDETGAVHGWHRGGVEVRLDDCSNDSGLLRTSRQILSFEFVSGCLLGSLVRTPTVPVMTQARLLTMASTQC